MRFAVGFITWVMLSSAVAIVRGDDNDLPYEAVWVDGTRETTATPPMWIARERKPTLGDRPIVEEPKLLRRVHRWGAATQPRVAERVEFIGGDRLTGRVVEYLPETTNGPSRPAALVIEPRAAVDEPLADEPVRIRVPIERIRRVVWHESTFRPYRPDTFFYRDGRRTTFRSIRWSPEGLKLLVEQGVEEVAWDDAAEVHLAERDPWEEYADQLSVLTPDASARLVRFETPGTMRVTVSLERLRASGDVAKPESQRFELFPAWSLDPIVLPQRLVSSQTFFAPQEAPLSNYEPSGYVHRAHLAAGWNQWRADLNVQGNPPATTKDDFGWGFGVHAYAALEFSLPQWAKSFRTLAALDRAAGDGGCVRAKVYAGPTPTAAVLAGKPLYESPVMIGGEQVHDSGRLELRPQPGRPNRLVLVADSLADSSAGASPPGADPLDLRDIFDWLEPLVELDAAVLKTTVAKHAASLFVRQHRWVVSGTYGDAWRWENAVVGGQPREVIVALKSPLIVSRTLTVPNDAEHLLVYVSAVDDAAGPVKMKLLISGQAAEEVDVPKAENARLPSPRKLAIPENRRGRDMKFELQFTAAKPGLRLDVHGFEIAPPAKK